MFEEIFFWFEIIKWILLIYMAYWLYQWSKEKLGFSQILVFAVWAILAYFLVIEHPIIGAIGIFGWIILTGGLLMALTTIPHIMGLLRH